MMDIYDKIEDIKGKIIELEKEYEGCYRVLRHLKERMEELDEEIKKQEKIIEEINNELL